MSQQHKKWIQLVKDKLNSEGMTQTHLARACGVKKPTISELLKYGKGSDRLKNRVCDVLDIDESWVDLGEQEGMKMRPKRYPYSRKKLYTLIKEDPEFVEKLLRPSSILLDSQSLTTRLQAKDTRANNIIHIDDYR